MAGHQYAMKIGENMAKAVGQDLPISTKQSVMVCKSIRGKPLTAAKQLLQAVVARKQPIRFTRFSGDMGHRPGMAAGRYPQKACGEVLKILESAEANAQFKGLSTGDLIVRHVVAHRSSGQRFGRKVGLEAKRTHVEVILEEQKAKKEEKTAPKKPEKEEPEKTAAKKEQKEEKPKQETKEEPVKPAEKVTKKTEK